MHRRIERAMIVYAGVAGALGVIALAVGAHAPPGWLPPPRLDAWRQAALLQVLHAPALLAVAALSGRLHPTLGRLAQWGFALGLPLFCLPVYGWAATGWRAAARAAPLGGLTLIAAWSLLAVAGALGTGRAGPPDADGPQ
ncbi:MAG: hypothetical protein KatS3mg121_1028 [Gammaproteobacteria bacterium]|nr:MAG: hypothetical protein KatS3mg121_1028 [Gammaproteobacteria bacterium]